MISNLTFSPLNILGETTVTGTVCSTIRAAIRSPTITINWDDGTYTTLTVPGGTVETFTATHEYFEQPRQDGPVCPDPGDRHCQ